MPAKKPEKTKQKQVTKAKKSVKEKPVEMKAKDKGLPKKTDKVAAVRANAVEKAKAKVRTAIEKVAAKVAKSVQVGSNGAAKAPKAAKAVAPAKVPAKVAKGAVVKPEKISGKAAKVEKEILEKPVKGAKAVKGAKTPAPAVVEAPAKKISKSEAAKLEAAAKKHAAAKNKCREVGCENEGLLSSYCRLHYIKNWRRIKKKESILSTGQLDGYVEELVAKYPDKYLDAIENDLHSEKEWTKVISDLELGAGGEEDFVAEEDDNPLTEATGRSRGAGFDDEDEDVY